ncbi:SMC-Scp complex subunit ScpB [Macrococcus brunensis]|uniref:SMC-Scp complex subunit ScpB n=1 Tax=Macrococcus brunensis TaxID=198483 RepID=A0A4R6BDI4_9STAP|nr:SMC-Scp complex subunit ScpB [Macrococcus brunensis]TDL97840.1 SMC-Scp complex subunit ScpB [Macrococcus brunensis]ULG71048.1 SMC-Scp complex subunit ScpB [Macrococcus brunensis]ULG73384.1 SMC-Scp complex subunit ScpB [Macrococcus brunensis]
MPAKIDIFEALLYAVGDEGLESERVESLLNMTHDEVEQLAADFSSAVFQLRRYGGKWFLELKSEYTPYLASLVDQQSERKLTQASMETLAIIAYNQPVTRSDVESLRGVNSDGPVRTLIERGLVAVKTEESRSQQLYTTDYFLQVFGLTSIEELPEDSDTDTKEEMDLFFKSLTTKGE